MHADGHQSTDASECVNFAVNAGYFFAEIVASIEDATSTTSAAECTPFPLFA